MSGFVGAFVATSNTAITTTTNLTAVGIGAGTNESGTFVTALGYHAAGSGGPSGTGTTAVGYTSLSSLTTGANNTALGFDTGLAVTTGGFNVFVGAAAGYLGNNTAGNAVVTGSDNTYLGGFAGPGSNADPSYTTAVGYKATCIGNGSVAIGTDHTGAGAAATVQDAIVLGTANHVVTPGSGTNTATFGANFVTTTFANASAAQLADLTRDYMIYIQFGIAGTAMSVAIGPTSTPADTIISSAAVVAGELFSFRLPAGWYAQISFTTTTIAYQRGVSC